MSSSNRRRHRRIKGHGLTTRLHSAEGSSLCKLVNLSLGGAFIRSKQLLPPGTAVTLELWGGNSRRALRVMGHVANIIEFQEANARGLLVGMGIEFAQLTKQQTEQLRGLHQSLRGIPVPADEGGRSAPREVQPQASSAK